MKRLHYIIYVATMCVVVLGFVVVFNLFERTTYSELENREVAKCPEFSFESLFAGTYTRDVSSWYSDSEPYRDRFMTLSMEFDDAKRLRLGSAEEEVTFIEGDSEVTEEQPPLIDTVASETEAEKSAEEQSDSVAVAQPQAEQKAKITNHGIVIVGTQPNVRALTNYRGGPTACNAYAQMANRYQRELGEGVTVYCMLIPTAIEFYCPEKAKSRVKSQRETIDNAYAQLDSTIVAVDAYNALKRHTDEDIYLRTDHHWAPLGAYYAAEALAKAAGVPFNDLTHYERKVVKHYVGSMYRYSQDISVKRSPEDFVYYEPLDIEYETTYINYIVDENYAVTGSHPPIKDRYFYKFNDGSGGAYCTFMGGDNKITQIRTATDNGRRMLLLKDSFGNAIPGYLFYSFEEIHVVDARYFTRNSVEYVRENGITDLVFGNNIAFAMSSSTINFYKRFLTQKSK